MFILRYSIYLFTFHLQDKSLGLFFYQRKSIFKILSRKLKKKNPTTQKVIRKTNFPSPYEQCFTSWWYGQSQKMEMLFAIYPEVCTLSIIYIQPHPMTSCCSVFFHLRSWILYYCLCKMCEVPQRLFSLRAGGWLEQNAPWRLHLPRSSGWEQDYELRVVRYLQECYPGLQG